MKSYFKAIMIFNEFGELRMVPLKSGVNIVTGESKTGKSALVEIIDYCLCSSRSTIPKGKITDFSFLYVIPMLINKNTYVIARERWENGGKMYVIKEAENFDIANINLEYFHNKQKLNVKDAQYEIESALGLLVTNVVTDDERKGKRASLRNMVSYMFQHQNLIASKFALFYRFSDSYRRKDIIEQFPVFAGMIDQSYYSDIIELGNLKKRLNQKIKIQKANEKSSEFIKRSLLPLLEDYYALLDIPFNSNITIKRMIELSSNLPVFDDAQLFKESGIIKRYHSLNKELEDFRNQEREVLLKINNLKDVNHDGFNFTSRLKEIKEQINATETINEEYICPLCGKNCEEIYEEDNLLKEAAEWLDQELNITTKYTTDFSEDIRKLKELHIGIEIEIKDKLKQIKDIENNFIYSRELVSKRERINYAKSKIILYKDLVSEGLFDNSDEEIQNLKSEITKLEQKISGFDLETKKSKAQTFLSNNMNRLALNLDFEEEYRPINLNFGLVDETFDLYQFQNNRNKIFLSEMGSGANWVSCHIALFLSFLRYFATQENSPMPLFMFFDQPSQVYFPQGKADENVSNSDINAVSQMYETIFEEIISIEEDTNITPQILIVDHVDGKGLEIEEQFKSHIRRDWRNGKALI